MQKAISKYWPIFVLPTLVAFIIGFICISGFHLSARLWLYGGVYRGKHCTYQCVWLLPLQFGADQRHQGHQYLPYRVLPMPNLIGSILLGHIWQSLLNGAGEPAEAPAGTGCQGRFCRSGHPDVLAADRLHDDHLCGRPANVPGDLIEAAKIDGANDREILFKIKIPMVMPSVTICTFPDPDQQLQAVRPERCP